MQSAVVFHRMPRWFKRSLVTRPEAISRSRMVLVMALPGRKLSPFTQVAYLASTSDSLGGASGGRLFFCGVRCRLGLFPPSAPAPWRDRALSAHQVGQGGRPGFVWPHQGSGLRSDPTRPASASHALWVAIPATSRGGQSWDPGPALSEALQRNFQIHPRALAHTPPPLLVSLLVPLQG